MNITAENLNVDLLLDCNDLHDFTDTNNNFSEIRQEITEQEDNENEDNTSNHPFGSQTLHEEIETERNQVTLEEKINQHQT